MPALLLPLPYMRPLLYILLFVTLSALAPAKAHAATYADSTVRTYYQSGQLKEKGQYRNGNKHGRWTTYNENGAIIKVVKYKNGKFWWERLYKNGKLSQITNRKGKVHKMKDCGC